MKFAHSKRPQQSNFDFIDCHPRLESLRSNVLDGLSASPKRIASKFLYDKLGSELFDKICAQPEYYQTRSELEILEKHARDLLGFSDRDRVLLLELGSGNNRKIRTLLSVLPPRAQLISIDISGDYLYEQTQKIAFDYPQLGVSAVCADFLQPLELPCRLNDFSARIAFFPGSTLGNFEPLTQKKILKNISRMVGPGGRLIIGMDRKNPRAMLEAAYNDRAGITAQFELNILNRMNREINATFQAEQFEYRGLYNAEAGRIEMYIVSRIAQSIEVDGQSFAFEAGETIHLENSYKYEPEEFAAFCLEAGLIMRQSWSNKDERFFVYALEVAP